MLATAVAGALELLLLEVLGLLELDVLLPLVFVVSMPWAPPHARCDVRHGIPASPPPTPPHHHRNTAGVHSAQAVTQWVQFFICQ